jgi:hypothetical protein
VLYIEGCASLEHIDDLEVVEWILIEQRRAVQLNKKFLSNGEDKVKLKKTLIKNLYSDKNGKHEIVNIKLETVLKLQTRWLSWVHNHGKYPNCSSKVDVRVPGGSDTQNTQGT